MNGGDALLALVAEESGRPVADGVAAAADDIRRRLGSSVCGVLFYGSCLRTGEVRDKVLDFYILVDSYRHVWGWRPLALANRLLPPNVFYAETTGEDGVTLRSKYAVLSLPHFESLCSARTFNSSVWARFAQPSRIVFARDDAVRQHITKALAAAVRTTALKVRPLLPQPITASELWSSAFRETYRAELRSEQADKGLELYEMHRDRYDAATAILLQEWRGMPTESARWCRFSWFLRRVQGKTLSIFRLLKGAFTFDGGIDYLAWKISRHSGVTIDITPWQRRHPLLGGLQLFWRLRRQRAFR